MHLSSQATHLKTNASDTHAKSVDAGSPKMFFRRPKDNHSGRGEVASDRNSQHIHCRSTTGVGLQHALPHSGKLRGPRFKRTVDPRSVCFSLGRGRRQRCTLAILAMHLEITVLGTPSLARQSRLHIVMLDLPSAQAPTPHCGTLRRRSHYCGAERPLVHDRRRGGRQGEAAEEGLGIRYEARL